MERPAFPSAVPSLPKPQNRTKPAAAQQKKLPTPEELMSQYESQGLNSQEASLKVIEDLQKVLLRVVSSGRGPQNKYMVESSRKIDNTNSRLAILEMKLDSKPGYAQTFAIGVASGAALRGIGSVIPHVIGSLGQIWNAVRSTTNPSSQS